MEPTQSLRPGWTAATLVALAVAPPFLLGSAHTPVIFALTAASLGVAAAGAWSLGRRGVRAPVSALSAALAILALVSLLQVVPLPLALLRALSPEAAQAHADLAGLVQGATSGPISLDPAQTALAAARWAGLLAASLGVGWLLRGRRSHAGEAAPSLARGLALAGLLQVLVSAAQRQWGERGKILGVFETERAELGLASGTFVNGNHAGAFLALAALAGAGALVGGKGWRRWLWGLCAAASAAGVVVGASRGAILALALGGAGLAAHLVVRSVFAEAGRGRAPSFARALPWVALVASPLALGLAWVGGLDLSERWAWELGAGAAPSEGEAAQREGDAKLGVIRAAWGMLPSFWRLGMGGDAFAVASPPFLGEQARAQFAFVESDPAELLLNFGVLAGGAALGLGLWAFAQTLAPTRLREAGPDGKPAPQPEGSTPALLGLGYGLLAWVVSAGVSFNAELLGLALPATVAVQVVLERRRRLAWVELSRPAAWACVAACAAAGLAGGLAHVALAREVGAVSALTRSAPTAQEVKAALGRAGRWAPADGRRLGEAALLLANAQRGEAEDRRTLALARLAARRAPYSAPGFLARARAASRLKLWDEAADGYRAALARLTPAPPALAVEACLALPDDASRARAIPERPDAMRAAVRGLLELKKPDEALGLALELRDRYPQAPTAHALATEAALAQGQPDLAELLAGQMVEAFPREANAYVSLAKAQVAQGRPLDALQALRSGLEAGAEPTPLRFQRAGLLLKLPPRELPAGADKLIEQDLEALRLSTLGDDDQRARYFYLSGLRQRGLGKHERARLDFERALKLRPQVPAYRQALGQTP